MKINQRCSYFANLFLDYLLKIAIRRDGKSPDLKVNDKQLQTANIVYIFYFIILSVNASKYGILTIIELTSFPL